MPFRSAASVAAAAPDRAQAIARLVEDEGIRTE
jgi:hypothetical protein